MEVHDGVWHAYPRSSLQKRKQCLWVQSISVLEVQEASCSRDRLALLPVSATPEELHFSHSCFTALCGYISLPKLFYCSLHHLLVSA